MGGIKRTGDTRAESIHWAAVQSFGVLWVMAEPRRVPFVNLSPMKPRESATETPIVEQQQQQQQNSPLSSTTHRPQPARPQVTGTQQHSRPPQREAAVCSSMVGEVGFMSRAEEEKPSAEETVRLELALSDPSDESCSEFSYRHLLQSEQRRVENPRPVRTQLFWHPNVLTWNCFGTEVI